MPDLSLTSLSLPVPSLAGFIVTLIALPGFIQWFKARELGQFIREEGPASHAAKARTPTMGGLIFATSTLVVSLGWLSYARVLTIKPVLVVVVALLCGALGLVDDLSKFAKKANAGLSAKLRLLLETALGLALGAVLLWQCGPGYVFFPPLLASLIGQGGELASVEIHPVLFLVTAAFFVAATTNALNLHDGMDGLAAGTSIQVLATMAAILMVTGQWPLAAVAAAGAGSVAGFLIFNRYPASIFMGEIGSLFVGGLMAGLAVAGGIEVWFIPLTLIYIVETLSVMMQVVYFKLTKEYTPEKPMSKPAIIWLKLTKRLPGEGKRLFRMAPLHHHFEAVAHDRGMTEWQVVAYFWIAQLVLCAAVLLLLKPT